MRVFLVIAHDEPHQRSFLHSLYQKAIETLKLNNHEFIGLDLYETGFTKLPSLDDYTIQDPKLTMNEHAKKGLYKEDVLKCQSCVEWCTHLMLFTPIHWLSPSAALMGWLEKVFGEGWAYTSSPTGAINGFMTGKKAMVVATCGMEQRFYGKEAINVTIEECMYNLTYRFLNSCGFTVLRTQAFFGLLTADAQTRVDMRNAWAEHVMNLETREAIEFLPADDDKKKGGYSDNKKTNHMILEELGDMQLMKEKEAYVF